MPQTLDTLTFPLHGARLIEASAGTGKTFTISGLYLRLLLGHGSEQSRHSGPLTVDKILVVTFTEAATAELRERIRSKIHDGQMAFLRGSSSDPVIGVLLKEVSDHQKAARLLRDAKRQMDEAAIFTIHGFCQRMLTQNAFESGSRFSHEFIVDETKLRYQAVTDYWRQNFYSLPLDLAGAVRDIWSSPAQLLEAISGQLSGNPAVLKAKPMASSLQNLHKENLAKIEELKSAWRKSRDDIATAINSSDVSKRSFTKKNLPAWIDEISRWSDSPSTSYRLPDKLQKFSLEFLQEKTPEGKRVPEHPLFETINRFLESPPEIKTPLTAHAIEVCRQKVKQAKETHHWLSFDDLLTDLSAALDKDEEAILSERIRALYPVAMIDEFQDTDPLQYSIFSRIYLNEPSSGLFMIGDPKQAIYGFRGADIFTYIKARNEVTDHYTLGTNWRSSADMVTATNALFKHSDSPFMYDEDIPFYPVRSRDGAEKMEWSIAGVRQKALNLWCCDQPEPMAKGDYLDRMAVSTAAKISQILKSEQNNSTCFSDEKSEQRTVRAGDIAVLVRTGREGEMIKQELAKKGVASVYLSNRDSVFASKMATAVLRLLQAVLYPEDERALRAALASDVLNKSSLMLDNLNHNEMELEAQINAFRAFRQVWQQKGVMPMLRSLMTAEQIAENLLETTFGERQLTDFLHLAELLQQASMSLDSDQALVRWFSDSVREASSEQGGVSDEQIQRLESEKNLVQIVTIHKSKGLEYDLVFIPFASSFRESKSGQYYDQKSGQTILDITHSPDSVALSDSERLAEDLRLIYVALTRAVYGCFIGIAPLRKARSRKNPSGAHMSAPGYLLQQGEELEASRLNSSAAGLASSNHECMVLSEAPSGNEFIEQLELFPESEQQSDEQKDTYDLKASHDPKASYDFKAPHELQAREVKSVIDRDWRITSYSGLAKQNHSKSEVWNEVDTGAFDIDSAKDTTDGMEAESERTIFSFPRGARPGTFLHTLFEEIDFTSSAFSTETQETIEHYLNQEQYDQEWLPIVQKMIHNVLTTPLGEDNILLNQKGEAHKLVEMEFLLPIRQLSAHLLTELERSYDPLSRQADSLGFRDVRGMLKGFIDLIFVHEEKYYVLDWKSNHLGDNPEDYSLPQIESVMTEHRYDLQYQIYALALHRFLQSRIPGYRYEQHFGGVYYLFLRGVDEQGRGVFFTRPDPEFIQGFDRLIDGEINEVVHD